MNRKRLTSNAGQQLSGKTLYLAAWKWNERIRLEKVEDALPKKIRNDADVVPIIKAISEVYALISIVLIIFRQR